jgi:hypothetical protein
MPSSWTSLALKLGGHASPGFVKEAASSQALSGKASRPDEEKGGWGLGGPCSWLVLNMSL